MAVSEGGGRAQEVDTAASEILTAAASLVDEQSDVGRPQSSPDSSESKRSGNKSGPVSFLRRVKLRNADNSDNESAESMSTLQLEQRTLPQQRALNHQLFTACRYGSGAAKLWKLINDGANINCYDQDHRTPLHYACLFGQSECVRSMITEPDINLFVRDTSSEGIPFQPSLAAGDAVMPGGVKLAGGKTPLHFAALGGHCPVLHAILQVYPEEQYHDEDAFGCNALHLAAEQGHMLAARMLMEHGFDIEAKTHIGYTAMHLAAHRGHQPIIGELMNFGAEPDPATEEGNTPLHLAASKGFINVVNLLIMHGASSHLRDKYDRTALHWASVNGHEIVVQRLIELMEGDEGDPKRKRRETVISDPFSCLMVNQMYCAEFS
ncbi:hypothetical protein CYMTET_56460 [Cymbomonas tetramitiformis]|uniref:Uncharacterized protein n=1 Tax=Cymbomonas tetramitiformis TaxID=36881 RepID=A0AAE0EMB0_9CHLO|nr:hypothetical protein CYMTET_56460 [Cymbomonas tetramitiformis]